METLSLTWQTDCHTETVSVRRGSLFRSFLASFPPYCRYPEYAGVTFNNAPLDFSRTVDCEGILSPIEYDSVAGKRLYRQTLTTLVFIGWQQCFPDRRLIVGQSINDSVFFYPETPDPAHPFCTPAVLNQLNTALQRLIRGDFPIESVRVPYYEAIDRLTRQNDKNAARLLQYRNDESLVLTRCNGIFDFTTSPLLPSTGKIKSYRIDPYRCGFLLRFPSDPAAPPNADFSADDRLFEIQDEFQTWSRILGLSNVGALNQKIESRQTDHFIRMNEMLHDNKIASIALAVHQRITDAQRRHQPPIRLILIAGPSSSGKTTFTKKLALHLQVYGYRPCSVSLDNYFLPLEKTPVDEAGKPDFESLYALNLPLLNDHLLQLLSGEAVEIPIFDFIAQAPKSETHPLQMSSKSIIIMEGIHALNPELTERVHRRQKFCIYVSSLTQLKIDDHNRIPTSDGRLLRRLVRDAQYRGLPPEKTFELWPNVRKGEDKNIFPFQHHADAFFNSALNYEIPVLKFFVSPLLRTVKVDSPFYGEALRFQEFLKYFLDIAPDRVPKNSILREFIGGSSFTY